MYSLAQQTPTHDSKEVPGTETKDCFTLRVFGMTLKQANGSDGMEQDATDGIIG